MLRPTKCGSRSRAAWAPCPMRRAAQGRDDGKAVMSGLVSGIEQVSADDDIEYSACCGWRSMSISAR